jgi:hypothetical protein
MKETGGGRGRSLFVALLLALGAAAGAGEVEAAPEALLTATCSEVESVGRPDPAMIPVVVTYMIYDRRPHEDVRTILKKDRLGNGFHANGEFNRIWGPKGIRFMLVGFRTCHFKLSKDVDASDPNDRLAPPFAGIPNPDVTVDIFENLFIRTLELHNTREIQVDGRKATFRGLDLYLWWEMTSYPGFAARPRFGRTNEESQRPGEPLKGRPGAIWMGTQCARVGTRDTCAGYFAHEAGHFLGLCHCCHGATDNLNCFNYLKPEYCPGLGRPGEGPHQSCTTGELGNRLMAATNPFTETSEEFVRIEPCELETARAGMSKVLRFGANGVSGSHP